MNIAVCQDNTFTKGLAFHAANLYLIPSPIHGFPNTAKSDPGGEPMKARNTSRCGSQTKIIIIIILIVIIIINVIIVVVITIVIIIMNACEFKFSP